MVYAALSALALGAADVLVKLASGKVSNSLGMLLYGLVPFLAGLIWFLARNKAAVAVANPIGIVYALGVGVGFASVTFGLYAAFSAGAPVSLASPLIRLGGLLAASLFGILVFKEPFSFRYGAGLIMASGGLYLMLTR
jgi:transporter family protein